MIDTSPLLGHCYNASILNSQLSSLMTSPTLKQVPYGEASFTYLRQAGWAYVDKTPFIRTLEEAGSRFHVLTRPRRFGKSLFANMLAAYYGKASSDDFETNFAGT